MSILVGTLVGLVVCFALLGFVWWINMPTDSRLICVYLPAIGAGVLMCFYMLWLFLTDETSPEEVWQGVKDYLQDAGD